MNSIDAVSILESCINELKNMTEEEFKKIKIGRGIDESKYLNRLYSQGDIQLVLPGTSEYNKFFEEETFISSTSIDYNENFQGFFEFRSHNNFVNFNVANAA